MNNNAILGLATVIAVGILALDVGIELGVAAAVSDILVVWIVYFTQRSRAVWAAAVLCSLLTAVGFAISPSGGEL
jgi:hypothetical protein